MVLAFYKTVRLGLCCLLFLGVMVTAASAFAQTAEETFARAVQAMHDGDDEKAIDILKPIAEQGDPKGMSLLGTLLYQNSENKIEEKEANKWWLKAAEAGDPDAMLEVSLSNLWDSNRVIPFKKAKSYIIRSVSKGHPQAQKLLGAYYLMAEVRPEIRTLVEPNVSKSEYWIKKAVENGVLDAKFTLLITKYYPADETMFGKGEFWDEVITLSNEGGIIPSLFRGRYHLSKAEKTNQESEYLEAQKWFQIAAYIHGKGKKIKKYLRKVEKEAGRSTALSDAWFRDHAKDEGTRYGVAAKWCVDHKDSNVGCLRNAIQHYDSCIPPHFPNYFENYLSSVGFNNCREHLMDLDMR